MKLLLILLPLFVMADGIDSIPEVFVRNGIAYAKFSDTPFTGKGKMIEQTGSSCDINIATFVKGEPKGAFSMWTCSGTLASKGTLSNGKIVGRYEMWDRKNGQKIEDKIYDSTGKEISGWHKHVYNGTVLSDLTWKTGKKSGYERFPDDYAYRCDNGLYSYFEDGKFIDCREYSEK